MKWHDHIEFNPQIMLGKPVIKGTRITVAMLLERLGDGWSDEDLLASFPQLSGEDLRAAQAYAATALSNDEFLTLDSTQ